MNSAIRAFVAYLGTVFTAIYFLITEKNNDFVRKNAAQSFTLCVFGVVVCISVFSIPFIGNILFFSALLFFVFLWVFTMTKSLNKVYYRIPFISDISEKYVVNWFIFK